MLSFLPLVPLISFGTWLSIIDLKVHRLPNQIVGWFTLTEVITLIVANQNFVSQTRLIEALIVSGLNGLVYGVLFAISRGSLGMGDVKFAFPLGLTVGWYSPELWLIAIFVTFGCAGLVACIGIVTKRMNRNSKLALGPYMFISSLLICLVGM